MFCVFCWFFFSPQQDKRKQTSKGFCLLASNKTAEELKLCVWVSIYKYENTAPEESVLSKSNLVCMLITFQCTVYLPKQKPVAGRYTL